MLKFNFRPRLPSRLQVWLSKSIANRAAFAGAVFGLSSIFFLGIIAIPVIYHQVAGNIATGNKEQASRLKDLFEYRLDATQESMRTLANNSFVVNAFVDSSGRETYVQPLLRDFRPPLNVKGRVIVLDMNLAPISTGGYGDVFASSSLMVASIALTNGKSELGVSGDGQFLLFASPVFYPPAASYVGIVLLEVPLANFFAPSLSMADHHQCFTLSVPGRSIFRSPCQQGSLDAMANEAESTLLRNVIEGKPIELRFANDEHSPLREFSQILLIYVLLATVAALFSWFVARRQVQRLTQPLIELSTTAQLIADNPESDATAPESGNDEVARLAQAFNQMLAQLRRLHGNLEVRVAEKTRELTEQGALFRELALMSSDWFWEQDTDFRFIQMSENFTPKTGVDQSLTLGKTRWELPVVGVSDEAFAAHRAQVERHESFNEFTYQVANAFGELRWFSVSGKPMFNKNGVFCGYLGTGHDITERKRAEQLLSRESHRNQLFLRTASDGIHILDTERNVIEVSDSFCTMLGYSREELLGMNLVQWSPDFPERIAENMTRLIRDHSTAVVEAHYLCKEGQIRDVEVSVSVVEIDGALVFYNSARDITERKKSEERLRNSEERLRFLLETSPIAVRISRASDREVLFANQSYSAYIETSSSDTLGVDPRHFYANPKDYDDILEQLSADRNVTNKLVEIRVHGKSKWVLASYLNLEYQGEAAVLGWFYDVTDIRRAQELAEETAQTKASFLANMSHEIRTPMNAVIGLSQLALEQKTTPQVRDYLEKIRISSQSLLGILNDILDYSKIEAGRMSLENAAFDLGNLLQKLNDLFFVRAEEKQLELSINAAPEVPSTLIGDELRLQQILANLIGNAIKFTEHGQVRLDIEATAAENSQIKLRFAISDTGIGMTPEVVGNLFQAFNQADNSITRRFGGTGLGLVISRELLHLMGSDFKIDSAPDVGTTFSFELLLGVGSTTLAVAPRHHHPVHSSLRASLQDRGSLLAGARILVAEDNRINQQVVEEFLSMVGVKVVLADNGLEAITALADEQSSFAAVLMDVHMPVMDGLEATIQLRRQARLANLPIIALTAGVTQSEQKKALASGMSDFITKPINPEALIETLLRWISPTAPSLPAPSPSPQAAATDDEKWLAPGLDLSDLLLMLNGDQAMVLELLEDFRRETADDLSAITNAITANDFTTAQALAHKLKGVAGNVGAVDVFACASRLDSELKDGLPSVDALPLLAAAYQQALDSIATLRVTVSSNDTLPIPTDVANLLGRLDQMLGSHELIPDELLAQLGAGIGANQQAVFLTFKRQVASINYKQARETLQLLRSSSCHEDVS